MISLDEWSTKYDFVVKVFSSIGGCSGTAWGNKVLTSAHCGAEGSRDQAGQYTVHSAYGEHIVVRAVPHPAYVSGVRQSEDYMILTLSSSIPNRQRIALKSMDLPVGSNVAAVGFGLTEDVDYPPRPKVGDSYPGMGYCYSYPTMCYGKGPNGACRGDSGGPVLYWETENCEAHVWPKSRACAVHLGLALGPSALPQSVQKHRLDDGTGTWCSSANGAQKLSFEDAVADCLTGSFQGMAGPCVGVVFNGPQPGDEGSEYGRFTTCWRVAPSGLGWQALVKPTIGQGSAPVPPPPTTAIVVGPSSGSSKNCGHADSRYHYPSTAGESLWIKSVAPEFHWVQ